MNRRDQLLKLLGIQCPHWTTIFLWTAGIAIMTALTVKDLRPIILNYYDADQNTQIQIKIRKFEENSRGPDLFLCIPLETGHLEDFRAMLISSLKRNSSSCMECEIMTNHSYDVWNREGPNFILNVDLRDKTYPPTHAIDYLGRGFRAKLLEDRANGNVNKTFITVDNLDWNYPIINSIIHYLNTETNVEKNMLISGSELPPSEDTNIRQAVTFDPKSLDFFYSLLTSLMCEFMEFHNGSETITHDQCRELLRDSSIVWNNHYCTRLPLAYTKHFVVAFNRKEKNVFKGAWVETKHEAYMSRRTKFLVLTENPTLHDEVYNFANNLCKSPDGHGQPDGQSVTLAYSLPSSAVEGRPGKLKTCYDESSASECEWNRRFKKLVEDCDCTSYVYQSRSLNRVRSNKVPERSKDLCITSTDNLTLDNFLTDCLSSGAQPYPYGANFVGCTDPCHSSFYQWQTIAPPIPPFTLVNRSFELIIRPAHETYVEFVSLVKDSSEDFISHIGGVFNFYLGLSGLSIIFFLIYLFDVGRRYCRLKKRGQHDDDGKNSAAIGWYWRWMQVTATIANDDRKDSDMAAMKKELSEMAKTMKRTNEELAKLKSKMELMRKERTSDIVKEVVSIIQRQELSSNKQRSEKENTTQL